ncbi:MAG TPA: prohibitin family protein [Planctomycetota bacterium]|nr:prohibitin family protein [Planctomycetota bacterium]
MRPTMLASCILCGLSALGCGTMIQPGEMGLKYTPLSDPGLEEQAHPEGFYFQWWWNGMVKYDVTMKTAEEPIEVLTVDDLHVPIRAAVSYRPDVDRLHDLHLKIGPTYYEKLIRPNFVSLLRTEFGNHKHNDLARQSPAIETKVLAQLKAALEGAPVQVTQITITHIDFDRGLTKAIAEKLIKQELLEQKRFEVDIAESDAEIARRMAKGQSDSIRIHSEGEAQAILTRAKAQAQAQEALAKTLTPAYLQFKAFDNPATRYYFVPMGKDGLPLIINAGEERPK